MNTIEIKQKIFEEIEKTNNKNLLEEIYRFLNDENESDNIYKLNMNQKSAIEEGRQQIKNGEFLKNDQVDIDVEKWLGK